MFIAVGRVWVKVVLSEISHIESAANYVKIHSGKHIYLSPYTMKKMIMSLPDQYFCRVNRYAIINLSYIVEFDNERVKLTTGAEFSFGETGRKEFKEKMNLLQLLFHA